MPYSGSVMPGICVAAVAAGPVFVTVTTLASLYLRLPAAIVVTAEAVGVFCLALIPATLLGAIVALPVNAIGALLMTYLGKHLPVVRSSAAWAIAGGVKGGIVAALLDLGDSEPSLAFGLVVTSALCGWLCSRWLRWAPQGMTDLIPLPPSAPACRGS